MLSFLLSLPLYMNNCFPNRKKEILHIRNPNDWSIQIINDSKIWDIFRFSHSYYYWPYVLILQYRSFLFDFIHETFATRYTDGYYNCKYVTYQWPMSKDWEARRDEFQSFSWFTISTWSLNLLFDNKLRVGKVPQYL